MKSIRNISFNDEKYFFYISRKVVKFVGFWPSNDVTPLEIAFAIFNAVEILAYGMFQLYFCFLNKNNLELVLNGLTPLVSQIVTALKIFFFVWKRNDMKKVLDYLYDSFVNGKIYSI